MWAGIVRANAPDDKKVQVHTTQHRSVDVQQYMEDETYGYTLSLSAQNSQVLMKLLQVDFEEDDEVEWVWDGRVLKVNGEEVHDPETIQLFRETTDKILKHRKIRFSTLEHLVDHLL